MSENVFECFAEMLIDYFDARIAGDLETAYKIKRKLIKKDIAESYKCYLCNKVDNKGKVVVDISGKLFWQCQRCINNEFIIKNTLFSRNKKENA